MSEDKLQTEVLDDESDWAFRYGQEARLRVELQKRYAACIYNIGVVLHQFEQVLEGVSKEEDDWIKKLPNYVDEIFDLGCLVQQFIVNPVGNDEQATRLKELAAECQRNVENALTNKALDELVENYLSNYDKENMKDIDKLLQNEPPLHKSLEERRKNHRAHAIDTYLRLFIKLMVAEGAPDEVLSAALKRQTVQ